MAKFGALFWCVLAPVALAFASRGQLVILPGKGKTVMERVMETLKTEDPAKIRALARQLRKEGETVMADRLEMAADLVAKMKKAPTDKLPASVDPLDESYLLNKPTTLDQTDLMVAAWLRAEGKGAPPFITADLYPEQVTERGLTPHEMWVLSPYFPVDSDLTAPVLHFGLPPGAPPEAAPEGLHAFTYLEWGRAHIRFPGGPVSMLGRWWLCMLAHELTHAAQFRVGMTAQETTDTLARYGYNNSPIEVQARFYQRLIYADLARRAREYFLRRGPLPVFP